MVREGRIGPTNRTCEAEPDRKLEQNKGGSVFSDLFQLYFQWRRRHFLSVEKEANMSKVGTYQR